MSILGLDVLKRNPRYLHLKRLQQEGKKRKDVMSLYMERNQNVLLILFHLKTRALHLKWIKNVLKRENK